VRTRDLEDTDDEDRPQKRQRGGEDDDEDDEDGGDDEELDAGRKKRVKRDDEFDGFSDGGEGGSDTSEEWHVGVKGDEEDSDLDSEEAFGESDEERFEGFAFGGSSSKGKKKKKKGGEEEEEEDDEDLESLWSDAIYLSTALDQFYEDEEEGEQGESGSEEDEESTDGDDESEEDDDEEDEAKLDALQSMIAGFAGGDEGDDEEMTGTGKPKLSLKDLGLFGVKDPHIKRSLRLMNKEEKAVKPGSSKKLEIPLAKRQQDRLLRTAAYEKTNETLERWIETVKHNRRADHLVFPLAQNAHDRGLDSGELMPITQKTSGTELENTILAIMEESGLGPSAKAEKKENGGDVAGESGLSQAELKEIARQRRRERELHSREMARAKRIKKIKSKAFRRIHRKELAREEQAAHDVALETGDLDSDEEREAADRRRAEERMGARHRESKWAKLGKKAGRAVWDDDFKAGLTDMTRRKEELRRRVEGRADGSDHDDGSDVSGDSGDEADPRRLLAELDRAAAYDDDDEPRSALMQMKFMQRGEEQRKKENDELVAQMRRELDSDYEGASDEDMEIGRRQFGGKAAVTVKANTAPAKKNKAAGASGAVASKATESTPEFHLKEEVLPSAPGTGDAWSRVEKDNRKSRRATKTKTEELDMSVAGAIVTKPSKPKPKAKSQDAKTGTTEDAPDSDEEHAVHFPLAIRDQDLVNRAFAGEDVAGEFELEKGEIEREDDEKEIDNTLPGWGSWAGEGVSAREKRRHQGRFITKVEGIKKRDRQDYKLKDVIINEKRIRKVCLVLLVII
jgi:U3 small nucleolar RNA-associated protein 14